MKRSSPLARKTPLKPVNRQRAAKRKAEAFGPQAALCRQLGCAVASKRTKYICWWRKSEPHHEPPRSVGGLDRDTVPLCREHHLERHNIGREAFEQRHGVDLRAVAAELHGRVKEDTE